MNQLAQLLAGGPDKGKSPVTNPGDDNEEPPYPPGFTPTNTQTQPDAYPQRVLVTIKSQYQADASTPMNFPTGSGSNPGDDPTNPVVPDLDEVAEMEKVRVDLPKQLEECCRWLEEKFKAMESAGYHCGINANDLSLVLDLVLPPKFKAPKFENLIGSAAKWYNQLSRAQIGSWKDLSQAFMKQYGYMTDIAPNRITLQNMEKKPSKSFRQYAQRWREVATQPPYPKWYDTKAQCEYHARITGHSIENCIAFKKLVERFIEMGIVKFNDSSEPNRSTKVINAIVESGGKRDFEDDRDCRSFPNFGSILPKASDRYRFTSVVVDYFTKWVEATSYVNVTKSTVSKFYDSIEYQKGIISDGALNLNNSTTSKVRSLFKIKHCIDQKKKKERSPGKILRLMKIGICACRTSVRTLTGATHFSLI
ncbi:CAP-Gly domain-containing linker protein 1-like [Gossypium australe]|uniref:CAP-Gly domain-containing linker protein 1-like n=1 Tax=Gossypium australe TaxID=47621 RepID=A0A5B6VUN5_9ROSI|nr:CAP-Gly domain-containing linker protein 1-like [Gossypium australe]